MPSITDVINEKYGVAGVNIADALSQAANAETSISNIADAAAALYAARNPAENSEEETLSGSAE